MRMQPIVGSRLTRRRIACVTCATQRAVRAAYHRSNHSEDIPMHAWLCENPIGVDALTWKELPTPEPQADEVRVAIRAASLNFPDILIVQNKYQMKPPLPFVPGSEYAGVVEAVGADVKHVKVGDA